MKKEDLEKLITKYLSGNASSVEKHEVEEWYASFETDEGFISRLGNVEKVELENRILYKINQNINQNINESHQIESVWEDNPKKISKIKHEIWETVLEKEFEEKHKVPKSLNPAKSRISVYLKVAAIFILAFFISVFIYNTRYKLEPVADQVRYLEKVSLLGQKVNIQLPDGSTVKLNAGSKLIVPDKFIGETREVELVGEGFFEVQRDEKHPFIVKTNNLVVKVLGTSFNVKAYQEDQDISVAVSSGKVAVNVTGHRDEFILYPDEMAVHNKLNQKTIKTQFNYKEILSWKDKTLYFNQANFDEILHQLERWYGVEFSILKTIDKRRDFSGKYENKSLEVVMEGLSYVFDFKYEIKDDQVIIK